MSSREPPIVLEPRQSPASPAESGAIIFLHGLSDEAAGVSNIGEQLQASQKLSHFRYIFPNAPENRDMMTTAWYMITGLPAHPPPRPELEDDEDEDGLLQSVKYVESLIQDLNTKDSIPLNRIVIGGFSQGMAVSLLLGLVSSKYAGKLAGVLAICGYLPLEKDISRLRKEHEISDEHLPGITKIFVQRGMADALVPKRYHGIVKSRLAENGYSEEKSNLLVKEYAGVPHTITGTMIGDIASWLRTVLPSN